MTKEELKQMDAGELLARATDAAVIRRRAADSGYNRQRFAARRRRHTQLLGLALLLGMGNVAALQYANAQRVSGFVACNALAQEDQVLNSATDIMTL